ncbi:MAG: rod shape-determining protein MreD [Rickettsiales bacterium]|nr:rod shape-determining protein MreD [Rickettsiales bacterium]
MRGGARLALPGEGQSGVDLRPSSFTAGLAVGSVWLLLQSSVLPNLSLSGLPFDPIVALLVASSLGPRRAESLTLAVALGLLADSLSGAPYYRQLMRNLLIVVLAIPARGHVVLRDRWMPTIGVALVCGFSGVLVYLFPALVGAELSSDLKAVPHEVLAAVVASACLWPFLLRVCGLVRGRGGMGRSS